MVAFSVGPGIEMGPLCHGVALGIPSPAPSSVSFDTNSDETLFSLTLSRFLSSFRAKFASFIDSIDGNSAIF